MVLEDEGRTVAFDEFFERATGFAPHAYQARLAEQGLPDLLRVPMGSGKSKAIVLAWLWRLLFASSAVRQETPRRLVIALPMRTLVDQFQGDVSKCLAELGLTDEIGVYVVMGGHRSDEFDWRMNAHRPSIVIGTVDCLVSKALNRAYGVSRSLYPIDFALISNGAHVVIDEIQLASASTVTLRQLAGFRRRYSVAESSRLTCMSATVDRRLINTVDNPDGDLVEVGLSDPDKRGRLGELLAATRTVQRVPGAADERAIAEHAMARHRAGARTLVVLNTVKAAKTVYRALQRLKPSADLLLLHSRFRGVERTAQIERLTGPLAEPGMIVVATQVIEAGVDIDSSVLITEAAPWPSICQRSGRCNRYALVGDAELWWFESSSSARSGPYAATDVAESVRVLTALEGRACTSEMLLDQRVAEPDMALRVLRRPDFLALFDTTPDLSGVDIDIAPYIREGSESLDCQVAWIDVVPGEMPEPGRELPPQAWRCAVPVGESSAWARGADAWIYNVVSERWDRVRATTRVRPGDVILAAAYAGGYDPATGFEPSSKTRVPTIATEPQVSAGPAEPDTMAVDTTNVASRDWQLLDDHLRQSRDQAVALIEAIGPSLSPELRAAVITAALTHDVGKTHALWQEALRATDSSTAPEGLLAKSPGRGMLRVKDRKAFRHELVSALLLGDPAAEQLRATAGVTEDNIALVRYLVAAHHGKVRLQVRQPSDSITPTSDLLGVRPGEKLAETVILDVPVDPWSADLSGFALGSAESWTRAALTLLDAYGPFVLGYLEMLVRVADWRASAGAPLPAVGGEAS